VTGANNRLSDAFQRLDDELSSGVPLPSVDTVIGRAGTLNRASTAAAVAVLSVGALGGVTAVAHAGVRPVAVAEAVVAAPATATTPSTTTTTPPPVVAPPPVITTVAKPVAPRRTRAVVPAPRPRVITPAEQPPEVETSAPPTKEGNPDPPTTKPSKTPKNTSSPAPNNAAPNGNGTPSAQEPSVGTSGTEGGGLAVSPS
jgi:hypothetical protein